MALLRDHRRCVALEFEGFRLLDDSQRCAFAVGLQRVGPDGTLEPAMRVEGVRESVVELRSLADQLRALADGSIVAAHVETIDDGFALQFEATGGHIRVEAWIDVVRLNPATRVLAIRGEPQIGLRFVTHVDELRRFWAELLEGLDRMYS